MIEAGRLKRAVRDQLNIEPTMKFAAPGVLDVTVNGQRVYSRGKEGRLPIDEVMERVRAAGAVASPDGRMK